MKVEVTQNLLTGVHLGAGKQMACVKDRLAATPSPEGSMLPADVTFTPVRRPDFALLRELARTIWLQHYTGIVSSAQIDFMLAGRFSKEALQTYIQSGDRWLMLLRVAGAPVGYCGYELAGLDGEGADMAAIKLGQLYLLASHRGLGLGRFMLGHVEGQAHECERRMIWLQVNRRNTAAIEFYRAAGFAIIREAMFEIGGGFVMDDYVMAKDMQPNVGAICDPDPAAPKPPFENRGN